MKFLRYLFAVLSLTICLFLTYGVVDYALVMIEQGIMEVHPWTIPRAVFSLSIYLPVVFLAYFLKKSRQNFDITKPLGMMIVLGLMIAVMDMRLSENPEILSLFYRSLEARDIGLRRFLPVLILNFLFGLSQFLLGLSLVPVQYYDRRIRGFRISLQISGICFMSLVGLFLFDFFLALAFGFLSLFFLTTHVDFEEKRGMEPSAAVPEVQSAE